MADRPPLANELFSDRPEFVQVMTRFRQCQPIIPYLQQLSEGHSVEQVLEGLQQEAEEYPERHRQLAAIRYYLHFMLWECERRWHEVAKGITNYKTLLDQVERWRWKAGERVCLVTFNYERMLEAALPTVGVEIRELADYIANQNYQVIKLHGSIHWAREVDTRIPDLASRNAWQVAYELIERAADVEISQRYQMVAEYPIGKFGKLEQQRAVFPALALPVETKRNYECPPEHLQALEGCIPEVSKLLIIGWRGTENNFLRMLAEKLGRTLRGMIVAGRGHEAVNVLGRLQQAGISTDGLTWVEGGFTDSILRRDVEHLLRT
jgi:hypothetical protein